jgi:hypothetical protein
VQSGGRDKVTRVIDRDDGTQRDTSGSFVARQRSRAMARIVPGTSSSYLAICSEKHVTRTERDFRFPTRLSSPAVLATIVQGDIKPEAQRPYLKTCPRRSG